MIEFMVIGLPRSGTTWAANWLTTERTHCLHDPLYRYHYTQLDSIPSAKILGVSCTGLWAFPEWVNEHPARKVILHRDTAEINASLKSLGLPAWPSTYCPIDDLRGEHHHWRDIFDRPEEIYTFLTGLPFDAVRHAELVKMNIQPSNAVIQDLTVTKRLLKELAQCRW